MARQNIPKQPKIKVNMYADLLGVDYQSDPTEISRRRSPEMVNMISDLGGNPIKRCGYRSVGNAYDDMVVSNGVIWAVRAGADGGIFADKIKLTDGESIDVIDTITIRAASDGEYQVNRVYAFNSYLYILANDEWIEYDTETQGIKALGVHEGKEWESYTESSTDYLRLIMPDGKFIPTVMTMYKPNGKELVTLPEGTTLTGSTQGVNLLTPFRRVEYCVTTETGTLEKFTIPNQALIAADPIIVEILDPTNFEWKAVEKATGSSQNVTKFAMTTPTDAVSIKPDSTTGTDMAATKVCEGWIQFTRSPYEVVTVGTESVLRFRDVTDVDVPAGVPNVRITYAPFDNTDTDVSTGMSIPCTDQNLVPTTTTRDGDTVATYTLSHLPIAETEIKIGVAFSQDDGDDVWVDYQRTAVLDAGEASSTEVGVWGIGIVINYDGAKTFELVYDSSAFRNVSAEYFQYTTLVMARRGYYRKARVDTLKSEVTELYDSRLFAAVDNHTYYSRSSSLLNMDDNFYFDVDNRVKLYAKTSSALAVIAEDTGKDLIYLAKGEYDSTLAMPVYTIKASNAGVGAISSKVSGTLNDEPIFLSRTGLYGITTNYYSEKYSISRSGKINRRLCKEDNLEDAVGANFNGYFYLAINGHMYVLDSRHKDASKNGDNSYECYYFEGVPSVKSIFVINNVMLFTDGEKLYRWNDDLEDAGRYLDGAEWDSDVSRWVGHAVKAKWCSSIDNDSAPNYYKVLNKKGSYVTVAPPMQTSCQVTIVKDANEQIYIGRFNGATFALSDSVLDGFTKKKIKKYKRLQFIVENNEPEPFGIISVVKSFTIGNLAKR